MFYVDFSVGSVGSGTLNPHTVQGSTLYYYYLIDYNVLNGTYN